VNRALVRELERIGWSAGRLAEEVNAVLGARVVVRSTVAEWVNAGRVPREPLPSVVAHVLSAASGIPVAVGELWPGRAVAQRWCVPADAGIAAMGREPSVARAVAGDLVRHLDRVRGRDVRCFLPVPERAVRVVPQRAGGASGTVMQRQDEAARRGLVMARELEALAVPVEFAHRLVVTTAEHVLTPAAGPGWGLVLGRMCRMAAGRRGACGPPGVVQRYRLMAELLDEPAP
jgi:hypothetical protein